jgi:hypothetical protein
MDFTVMDFTVMGIICQCGLRDAISFFERVGPVSIRPARAAPKPKLDQQHQAGDADGEDVRIDKC